MDASLHPLAPHALPFFAPGADGSDPLMAFTVVMMLVSVMAIGVVFLWIHSLPERMAHRTQKVQMEIVAVLCLLALLTHVHAFWVAALLLALIDLPSLANPVDRIAGSLERIADRGAAPPAALAPAPEPAPPAAASAGPVARPDAPPAQGA
jgi:hypothetical protein